MDTADETPRRDDHVIAVIFGLLFLCGGLVFVVGSLGAYHRDTTLLATGERTQAQVVALERIRDTGPDGSTDHLVRYRFTAPDGRTIVKQSGLGRSSWEQLRVGGPVEVVHRADDPTKAMLVDGGVTSLAMVLVASLFGLLMGAGGGALLAAVAWRFRRRSRGGA